MRRAYLQWAGQRGMLLDRLLQRRPVLLRLVLWQLVAYLHQHQTLVVDVWAHGTLEALVVVAHGGEVPLGLEDEDPPPGIFAQGRYREPRRLLIGPGHHSLVPARLLLDGVRLAYLETRVP